MLKIMKWESYLSQHNLAFNYKNTKVLFECVNTGARSYINR